MATTGAAGAASNLDSRPRWWALTVLCVAVLVVNLDNTILNVALPTLVTRLRATTDELQWIVDAYAMAFGGLLLLGGSLADRFGRRRLFLVGLAVFGGGSLGAAFSGSVGPLIAWRAVMGAGAAMTIPSGLSIVNDMFREPAERARAVALWSGTIGLGIAIGPVAGGLLLSRFWWGSVFLVNVPVVIAGLVGTVLLVPESRSADPDRPDPLGSVLSIAGPGADPLGDHRGAERRLALGGDPGHRGGRAGGDRRLRRLGTPDRPPDAATRVLPVEAVQHRRRLGGPRAVRPVRGAFHHDPVPPVLPRLLAARRGPAGSCRSPGSSPSVRWPRPASSR